MKAGTLNKRVTIQRLVVGQDALGAPLSTWQSVAEVWAGIQPLTAREAVSFHAMFGEVTHKVNIRYRTGITPKMQIKFHTRTFDIEGVINPREANTSLELTCREVVGT